MHKDELVLRDIIDDLYEGVLDRAAWDRGTLKFMRLVNARGQLCNSFDPTTGRPYREQSNGFDLEMVSSYNADQLLDIRMAPALEQPLGVPFTEQELFDKRAFVSSEYFNEFLLPNDAPWLLATWVHQSPRRCTYFSVQGSRDRPPFDARDRNCMLRVLPHVRRSLEIQDRLSIANLRADALAGVVERCPFGVLLLDSGGLVLEASSDAVSVLKEADLLAREPGGRYTFREPTGGELRQLLGSNLRDGRLPDGGIQIRRGPGRLPLSLVIAPIPSAQRSWFCNHEPGWIALLFDPETRMDVSVEMVRDSLGLTAREAQVVALLAGGLPLKEIARRLGVSVHTVRAQLKSVFLKTGVRSQSELVRKVMLGPVVGGPGRVSG